VVRIKDGQQAAGALALSSHRTDEYIRKDTKSRNLMI
jgi:hypothetical protein